MTEELKRRMANKSDEFWEGYDAIDKHRRQNPYQNRWGEADKCRDWEMGWLTKFYGETI